MTERVPEVVEAVLALPVEAVVLDGEAIALKEDGTPHRFQRTMSRFGSGSEAASARRVALSALFFDVLHVDGEDVLDLPAQERHAILERVVPPANRVPRVVAHTPDEAERAARRRARARARRRDGQRSTLPTRQGAGAEAG